MKRLIGVFAGLSCLLSGPANGGDYFDRKTEAGGMLGVNTDLRSSGSHPAAVEHGGRSLGVDLSITPGAQRGDPSRGGFSLSANLNLAPKKDTGSAYGVTTCTSVMVGSTGLITCMSNTGMSAGPCWGALCFTAEMGPAGFSQFCVSASTPIVASISGGAGVCIDRDFSIYGVVNAGSGLSYGAPGLLNVVKTTQVSREFGRRQPNDRDSDQPVGKGGNGTPGTGVFTTGGAAMGYFLP